MTNSAAEVNERKLSCEAIAVTNESDDTLNEPDAVRLVFTREQFAALAEAIEEHPTGDYSMIKNATLSARRTQFPDESATYEIEVTFTFELMELNDNGKIKPF